MSLALSTAAQRAELVAACNLLAVYLNEYTERQNIKFSDTALLAQHQAYLTRVQAALTAIANAS